MPHKPKLNYPNGKMSSFYRLMSAWKNMAAHFVCDPDKGAMNAPLSLLQGLKVKEIGKKTKPKEENSIKPKVKARKELKTKKTFVTKSGFKRISTKSNSKTLNDPNKV